MVLASTVTVTLAITAQCLSFLLIMGETSSAGCILLQIWETSFVGDISGVLPERSAQAIELHLRLDIMEYSSFQMGQGLTGWVTIPLLACWEPGLVDCCGELPAPVVG